MSNTFFGCMVILLSVLVFFLVQSRLAGGPPTIAGYRLYAVLSGSMSPAFDAGSLVAVRPVDPDKIGEDDVITFISANGTMVTHRIVGIERQDGLRFVTKGDANNSADSGTVPEDRVVGVVTLALPWLGRLLMFSQTRHGLLTMIIIPALVVLILEGHSLWQYAGRYDRAREEKEALELRRIIGVMEGSDVQEGDGVHLNGVCLPDDYGEHISGTS